MAIYSAYCRASPVSGTTEETMIDIDCPSDTTVRILAVYANGSGSNASDVQHLIRLLRKSAIGTGSIAGNIIKKDPLSPNSVCTVTMNDNTNVYNIGTITDVIDEGQWNARDMWRWVATRPSDAIVVASGEIFGVNIISSTGTAQTNYVGVTWKE